MAKKASTKKKTTKKKSTKKTTKSAQSATARKSKPKKTTTKKRAAKAKTRKPKEVVTKQGRVPVASGEINDEMIAKRAFEIWERRGRPDGQCDQNWRDAEAELKQELGIA